MSKIVKIPLKDTVNPRIINDIIYEMSDAYDGIFNRVVVRSKSLTVNFLLDIKTDDIIIGTVKRILKEYGKNV